MSYYGRRVVRFDFEKRWADAHRAGKVHPFEAHRIVAGDYGPILRELEPEFAEDQVCVLRWVPEQRQAVRDPLDPLKLTGEVIRTPRQPLFEVIVRDVVRHRTGHWRVRFHVTDRRDRPRLVRRKPPALREGEYVEATPEEVAEAAVESAYTSNSIEAVDHLDAVPAAYQNVLDMQAKERRAGHLRDRRQERDEQEVREDIKRAHAQIKALALGELRAGRDPKILLGGIQQLMAEHERELQAAA